MSQNSEEAILQGIGPPASRRQSFTQTPLDHLYDSLGKMLLGGSGGHIVISGIAPVPGVSFASFARLNDQMVARAQETGQA
jgi:hypothetical protein